VLAIEEVNKPWESATWAHRQSPGYNPQALYNPNVNLRSGHLEVITGK